MEIDEGAAEVRSEAGAEVPALGVMLAVALVWGATNPFIKRGSESLLAVDRRFDFPLLQIAYEMMMLFSTWRCGQGIVLKLLCKSA